MPNQLTTFALDMALELLVDAAVVALTRNNLEIADAGYRRQPFQAGNPYDWDGRTRVISNSEQVTFGPWRGPAEGPITGWALMTEGGDVLATGTLTARSDDRPPIEGDVIMMGANEVTIGFQGMRRQ